MVDDEIKNGDLIFQTSLSKQSMAIQLATHSKYSHCGIIFKKSNEYYVFEAVQPVRSTPLNQWIARGQNGKYVIKRIKNADHILTPAALIKMERVAKGFNNKNYDVGFGWSDDKIYCSELIWKIYDRGAGIKIGKLQKLRDFDLTNAVVKRTLAQRYGDHIPLDETVVSPISICNSPLLVTVKAN